MKFDKTETAALIVLFVGVILLAFTFFSAYGFLSGELSIIASTDLTELFGRAMAPLITAIIHILYLGIMGWIGSILTIRGVQLLKREKETATTQPQVMLEAKSPAPQALAKTEPKPEVKESKKSGSAEKNPEKTEEKAEVRTQVPEQPKEREKKVEELKPSEKTVESIA